MKHLDRYDLPSRGVKGAINRSLPTGGDFFENPVLSNKFRCHKEGRYTWTLPIRSGIDLHKTFKYCIFCRRRAPCRMLSSNTVVSETEYAGAIGIHDVNI